MDENVKPKKKVNIVIYTIFMAIVFYVMNEIVIWGYGGGTIVKAMVGFPQGFLAISEMVLAALVLILVLIFGNSYIFSQKRSSVFEGLFYGLFFVIMAFILFLANSGAISAGLPVLNILIGAFFVGITEEFFCRGWFLNEFLERYGDTKKGVLYSIWVSALLFGLMHLGNFFNGQDLATTIIQIINAAALGVCFGAIYYKTKNIWSVVILHAAWDFVLFLGDLAPVTELSPVIASVSIGQLIFTVLSSCAAIFSVKPLLKDFDKKQSSGTIIGHSLGAVTLYIIFIIFSANFSGGLSQTEVYKFTNIKMDNYAVLRDNYTEYHINESKNNDLVSDFLNTRTVENYKFKLYMDDDVLTFVNETTNYSIDLQAESLEDYIIVKTEDGYVIGYEDFIDKANHYLYYKFVSNSDLSNEDDFLNQMEMEFKKYLLPEDMELLAITDGNSNKTYLAAQSDDYGYYVLEKEDSMSILNRD